MRGWENLPVAEILGYESPPPYKRNGCWTVAIAVTVAMGLIMFKTIFWIKGLPPTQIMLVHGPISTQPARVIIKVTVLPASTQP